MGKASSMNTRQSEPPRCLDSVLLFQFMIISAFWVGIYLLHEQALTFSDAYRKAEERAKKDAAQVEAQKAIMGRWQVVRAPSVELELRNGRFTISRENTAILSGEYVWSEHELKLETRTAASMSGIISLRCQLVKDEMMLSDDGRMFGANGNWYFFLYVLGRDLAPQVYAEEKVLRFRRTGD